MTVITNPPDPGESSSAKPKGRVVRYAWLSVVTAVVTISLKFTAYALTGSVGLLSDALESGINLLTAGTTLLALLIANIPPDDEHTYGHTKAEYFSSTLTGFFILAAAGLIVVTALYRLWQPEPLAAVGWGMAVASVAALLNFIVARVLIGAGREHRAVSLVAEGQHLLTDVWTSVGVVVGLGLVWLTGWLFLDGVVALLVGIQIGYSGGQIVRQGVNGLMDHALPAAELAQIKQILDGYGEAGVHYHALRTRQAGRQRFISVHLQMPGEWTVQRGHDVAEEITAVLKEQLPEVSIFTHVEPIEDPRSWDDVGL